MTIHARDPAAEATAMLGGDHVGLVLEPSPPAVGDPPFFADDPVARPSGRAITVVSPVSAGDRTWAEVVEEQPDLREWAAARWLAAHPPLPPVPAGYPAARDAYHRLAYAVVAEARRLANTKFGLRYTHAGFGTPFFGPDRQVRVEHGRLVVQVGDEARDAPVTTIAAAAAFVGVDAGTEAAEHDSPPLGDIHRDLGADPVTGEGISFAIHSGLMAAQSLVDANLDECRPPEFIDVSIDPVLFRE